MPFDKLKQLPDLVRFGVTLNTLPVKQFPDSRVAEREILQALQRLSRRRRRAGK